MQKANPGEEIAYGVAPDAHHTETSPGLLLWQQLEALYRNWQAGVAGHLVLALLVVSFFWPVVATPVILGWFAALTATVGLRIIVLARFSRSATSASMHATDAAIWLRRLMIVTALHGLIWGSAGPLLVPSNSMVHTSIMLLVLAGITSGAIVSLSAHFGAVVTFIVPALLPYGVMLAANGAAGERTLGIAVLCFAIFNVLYARAANRTVLRGLKTQADNVRLIDHLDREKCAIAALNRQLSDDINRREQVEIELRLAKDHAEYMADRLSLASALDGLTGLSSSGHFDDVLKREWSRAARGGTPLAIILCDIDAFGGYCEKNGHGKGDELLRLVAHVLLLHARRANDLVARTGEQRFALLMPLAETAQASRVAEQIREAVRALEIEHGGSPRNAKVTVSLGVASLIPQKGMGFKVLEQTADSMLQPAKAGGRDQVCAYTPVLGQPGPMGCTEG